MQERKKPETDWRKRKAERTGMRAWGELEEVGIGLGRGRGQIVNGKRDALADG